MFYKINNIKKQKGSLTMIIHLTNACDMGCTHCLQRSTIDGEHMSIQTFVEAIKLVEELKPLMLLVSGGEPTMHPNFMDMLDVCINTMGSPKRIIITSNGYFLKDEVLTEKILNSGVTVQITNDSRYYPRGVKVVEHERLKYVYEIPSMWQIGRAKDNGIPNLRKSPQCFNLISACKSVSTLKDAIHALEYEANKFCSFGIEANGDISLGEAIDCMKMGNVSTDNSYTIFRNIKNIKLGDCNVCGLEDNLPLMFKAIYSK